MMQNKKKIFKTIGSVLWFLLIASLALLMITVLSAKMQGRVPSVLGYSVMQIVSGSMEPQIPSGSYILVRATEPENIKKGDIISFYSDDPTIKGLPNTHRVAEEPHLENGTVTFTTRGDANVINDQYAARGDALIGVYVGQIGFLSALSRAMSGGGIFILLLVLQALLCAFILYSVIKKKHEPDSD